MDFRMDSEPSTNGSTTPQTPKTNGLALTEYTANPTPPNERLKHKSAALSQIPEDVLLPNGYPDVGSSPPLFQFSAYNFQVLTPHPYLPCLRCRLRIPTHACDKFKQSTGKSGSFEERGSAAGFQFQAQGCL